MVKTNIFQEEWEVPLEDGTTSIIYYYSLQPPIPRNPVRLRLIGRLYLPSRKWEEMNSETPSHIFKLSWWKGKVPAPGEGRITDGRVIKNRVPPSHIGETRGNYGYYSIVETELPPEAI